MKQNEEYIIDKNGEIIPVDQDNTGVIKKNQHFLMDYTSFYK